MGQSLVFQRVIMRGLVTMPNTYRLNSHGMFDRRQDRNMRRVIFLSVEGTKTEVEYFGYINKYKTSLGVESIVEFMFLSETTPKVLLNRY